jgi:hypothetical protein
MGHIEEPKSVDFVIKSEPWTDKARQAIREFIRNYKKSKAGEKIRTALAVKQPKTVQA